MAYACFNSALPRSSGPAAISDIPSRKCRFASARASASAGTASRSRAEMHPCAIVFAHLLFRMWRLTRQSVRIVLVADRPLARARHHLVRVGRGGLLQRHAQRDVLAFGL